MLLLGTRFDAYVPQRGHFGGDTEFEDGCEGQVASCLMRSIEMERAGMSSPEEPTTYSYEEALKFAKFEAKRILQANAEAVRYVKYEDFFKDYCVVYFTFDASGRAPMMMQMLPLSERQSDEHFTDDHIVAVARAGHLLDAIRLYRLLHSADLMTAKLAVEAMIKPA